MTTELFSIALLRMKLVLQKKSPQRTLTINVTQSSQDSDSKGASVVVADGTTLSYDGKSLKPGDRVAITNVGHRLDEREWHVASADSLGWWTSDRSARDVLMATEVPSLAITKKVVEPFETIYVKINQGTGFAPDIVGKITPAGLVQVNDTDLPPIIADFTRQVMTQIRDDSKMTPQANPLHYSHPTFDYTRDMDVFSAGDITGVIYAKKKAWNNEQCMVYKVLQISGKGTRVLWYLAGRRDACLSTDIGSNDHVSDVPRDILEQIDSSLEYAKAVKTKAEKLASVVRRAHRTVLYGIG